MGIDVSEAKITIAGSAARAAHCCYFYSTKQDLLDILVPYLKTGLEKNESCLWVISDPLTLDEARSALRQALPNLDRYPDVGGLEFILHNEWYLSDRASDSDRVIRRWRERLDRALSGGSAGLRVTGDTSWLEEKDWPQFLEYERQINESFAHQPMTALCTFPVARNGAADLLNVAHVHQALEARRNGSAQVLPTTELKRATERTQSLAALNEELRGEIEERENIENELRKQKEILQKIFDHVPIMLAFVSEDGRKELVNAACEHTLGWTREEFLRRNLDIFKELYPDLSDRQRVLNFLVNSSGDWDFFRTKVKDGRVIDTTWSVVRLSDGTRIDIGQDITARKRAEEALRESEERFRQLAENIRELFWIKTPDFKHVLYLSPSYESFTGRDRATRWRQDGVEPFLDIIHPEDRESMAATMRRANGEEFEIEFRIVMPDGSLRWIRDRGFPIRDESGHVYRIAGIAQNVTERKLAEERLKATSEQLRALSASVQLAREEERARIAREIHDELGSGLTSLKWDLEGLAKTFCGPVEQSQPAALQEKTASMLNMTETIINTVRRIASELRPSILDDLGLVDAIEWQGQQFQARTGILCRCIRSVENVALDREQSTAVFRIFQEVLTNVLRHAQATRVIVTMDESENGFILTVTDNGRGIAEREKSGPLSLGLLGMQERAHLIGGSVNIAGVEGNGSVITVQVPAKGR